MIRNTAQNLLRNIRSTNFSATKRNIIFDSEMELLIGMIADECKSSVYDSFETKVYGGKIQRKNIEGIIKELVTLGHAIPESIMKDIMVSYSYTGMPPKVYGVYSDVELYKGVTEDILGNMVYHASLGQIVIDLKTLPHEVNEMVKKEIFEPFSKKIVLCNQKILPKQTRLSVLKAKVKDKIFSKDNTYEELRQRFIEILQQNTKIRGGLVERTVDYNLECISQPEYIGLIINNINSRQTLVPIENAKGKITFEQLVASITEEINDMPPPDLNEISKEITQLERDAEALLIAYSVDISKMTPETILQTIKAVNHTSLTDDRKDVIGKNGYRNRNVCISGNNRLKFIDKSDVEDAMENLSKDIYMLAQNAENLSKEDYLKRAVALSARFIKIHPFPDSNGRTSRAILNMMTLQKGMMVKVPKEIKDLYVDCSNELFYKLDDEYNYNEMIENNDVFLKVVEHNQDSPLYRLIASKCVVDVGNPDYGNRNKEINRDNKDDDLCL